MKQEWLFHITNVQFVFHSSITNYVLEGQYYKVTFIFDDLFQPSRMLLLSVLLTIFSSRIIQGIMTLFQLQSVAVPRTLHVPLFPYQLEGQSYKVIFVLDDIFQPSPMLFGVCVADDLFQSIPLESSPVQSSPAIVDGLHKQ